MAAFLVFVPFAGVFLDSLISRMFRVKPPALTRMRFPSLLVTDALAGLCRVFLAQHADRDAPSLQGIAYFPAVFHRKGIARSSLGMGYGVNRSLLRPFAT